MAGGCVLSCLLPDCVAPLREESKDRMTGANGFHASDIDLFIHGLTPAEATAKLK